MRSFRGFPRRAGFRSRHRGTELLLATQIQGLMRRRELLIEPILKPEDQLKQTGVDLRLDNVFGEFERVAEPYLSPAQEGKGIRRVEKEFFYDTYFLQPGEFALGKSFEYIALPNNVVAMLNGKSSLGRRGLIVHATANIIDPGWRGHIVFEFVNLGTMPIELFPLMCVAKLVFFRIPPATGYTGKYAGQIDIITPGRDEDAFRLKTYYEKRRKELEEKRRSATA